MTQNAVALQTAGQPPGRPKPPLAAGGSIAALVPQDFEQAWRVAQVIAGSGMAPRDMATPEKLVVSIMHGLEIGLPPMQAIQSIAVVNGRPTIWGDGALGLVRGSGLLEDYEETIEGDGDAMRATCRCNRRGQVTPIVRSFSVADARKAGLWGKAGPWTQYPRRMLAMRARAFALRDGFADVLKGIGVTEEVHDYSGPAVTPATTPAATVSAAALRQQAGIIDGEAREITGSEPPTPPAASGAPAASPATTPQAEQAPAGDPSGWSDWLSLRRREADSLADAGAIEAMRRDGDDLLATDGAPAEVLEQFAEICDAALKRVGGRGRR
jgi:hypothetical protein